MRIQEATEILVHEIAPKLTPNLKGKFQARLIGMYRNHAEIGIYLVNDSGETLKSFGTRAVKIGDAVSVDNYPSMITVAPNTLPIKCYIQAWLIGMDKENTEAEIALRLVDDDRKKVVDFGSARRKQGGTITINGLDVTLNITPKGFH